jgi:hypothetical protein
MKSITEFMVDEHIAENGYAAGHIYTGLKLQGLPREEQERLCRLYRRNRPKTDKKNDIPSWQAYALTIAGIDITEWEPRQIKLPNMRGEMAEAQMDDNINGEWMI